MKEIEVKILDIDVEDFKRRLESIGATYIKKVLMRRYVYFLTEDGHHWIRIRDQGDKVTLCVKKYFGHTIDGTEEYEVDVDSFENTHELINAMGFKASAYQENQRTSYKLGEAEIEIDVWPQIPVYAEIEAPTKELVEETVRKLRYTMDDVFTLNTRFVYDKYGIDITKIPKLKFEKP